jgi:hypothetical protein
MLKEWSPGAVECEQLAVVLPECAELVALAEAECDAPALAEGLLDAVGDADDDGVSVSELVGTAAAELVGAVMAADELDALVRAAAAELDALDPQAARPAPPMATAMMTAGTRHFNILDPPLSHQTLQKVTHNNSAVTIGAGGRAARRS